MPIEVLDDKEEEVMISLGGGRTCSCTFYVLFDHVLPCFERHRLNEEELADATKVVEDGEESAPARMEAAVDELELATALRSSTTLKYLGFE